MALTPRMGGQYRVADLIFPDEFKVVGEVVEVRGCSGVFNRPGCYDALMKVLTGVSAGLELMLSGVSFAPVSASVVTEPPDIPIAPAPLPELPDMEAPDAWL